MAEFKHGNLLAGVTRCPHCGVAMPTLGRYAQAFLSNVNGGNKRMWGIYCCSACGAGILAKGAPNPNNAEGTLIEQIYPPVKIVAEELPEPAKIFLQQAYEVIHAPDAAAVMAGSAVDAMLKAKGLVKGTLYERIDQAVEQHILTKEMGDWAHWVRLGSNRPRHADKDKPHVTADEARQSVEFAEALGQFLFVLSSRIAKGIEEAQQQ